ncbi:MAG: tetratricopeptide (TPR) repeat protein [Flammeovirgaceae bacterium]|jgi:tetratricopeptide (TPR) repeat protein
MMNVTEINALKRKANQAFQNKEYNLVFSLLSEKNQNPCCQDLLFRYFSKPQTDSAVLFAELANHFPSILVEAVRVNQLFLREEFIEFTQAFKFSDELEIHAQVWRSLYERERAIWNRVISSHSEISHFPFNQLFAQTSVWLKENSLQQNGENDMHLAKVYSLFVEFIVTSHPEDSNNTNHRFDSELMEFFLSKAEGTNSSEAIDDLEVAPLLNSMVAWVNFNLMAVEPYSFDLATRVVKEDGNISLSELPKHFYNYEVDEARYKWCEANYMFNALIELEEKTGKPTGVFDKEVKPLALRNFFTDLCFANNLDEATEMANIASLLLNYASEKSKENGSFYSVLTTTNDFQAFNLKVSKGFTPELSNKALSTFSSDVKNLSKKKFDRRKLSYDVWSKPFLKTQEYHFVPTFLLEDNGFFYSYANNEFPKREGDRNAEKRNKETDAMEEKLKNAFKNKGWNCIRPDTYKAGNSEKVLAKQMEGDVDLFVWDGITALWIQLKRTKFRHSSFHDVYREQIQPDRKASQQLNDAEQCLKANPKLIPFTKKMGNNTVKWIISTSFEGVNQDVNGYRKTNYFDILNALSYDDLDQISKLIDYVQSDGHLHKYIREVREEQCFTLGGMYEVPLPVEIFDSLEYRNILVSDDRDKLADSSRMFQLAKNEYDADNLNKAVEIYQRHAILNPNDGDAYGVLANVLADLGRYDEAIVNFEIALKMLSNDLFIARNYIATLNETNDFKKALELAFRFWKEYSLVDEFREIFEKVVRNGVKTGSFDRQYVQDIMMR